MSPDSLGPLSRPIPLGKVTPAGLDVDVEATPEERAALALDFALPAIHALAGRLHVASERGRVRVTGRVTASLDQVCVVTLEPFRTSLDEEVEVEFQPAERLAARDREIELDPDATGTDELVGDRIDLGTITAEFFALGLDPYPRKPGVAFEPPPTSDPAESPFAGLADLRARDEGS